MKIPYIAKLFGSKSHNGGWFALDVGARGVHCAQVQFSGAMPRVLRCEFHLTGEVTAEALGKLRLKIDAEEASELTRIRKKLKLSQRRATAIAGGGVNAFSRYENGKARPVAAVVNLFRLLDKHPELIDELTV